jgi:hypothetical protein
VTPAGKKYSGAIEPPSRLGASMEAMWQQSINTLAKVFFYDVAEITRLFQDYLYNPRQFDSMKDLCSNSRQFISFADQQLDIRSFTDPVKRIKAFFATECTREMFFCHVCNLIVDIWHHISDSKSVDLLMIKIRIRWPDVA